MKMTNTLLIGSGAREHAIAEALCKTSELSSFMSNQNPGIKKISSLSRIGNINDPAAVTKFAKEAHAELAVIGPEAPLAAGVVDELERAGIKCFGPTKELAQLESSKSFVRILLEKHKINASPQLRIFNKKNSTEIEKYLTELGEYVIKPDGLTGGKGVKVFGEHILDNAQAIEYCKEIFASHGTAIIEEKLEGEEFSLQSITDGKTVVDLPAVQDHKRAFEDDKGPNTGGMGSYSDSNHSLPFLKQQDLEQAHEITVKVAAALNKDFGAYKGVMYGGFMVTRKGVKLIEYNARFGDPEAINTIPLIKEDFSEICMSAAEGRLRQIHFEKKATVCKYVVPNGYPEKAEITKIYVPDGIRAYYAAVEQKSDGIYSTKSRAVATLGIADTIIDAEKIAEEACNEIKGNVFHRKDIGTEKLLEKRTDHMNHVRGLNE